jgi:hypothetical protein
MSAQISAKSPFKTAQEMEAIRTAQGKINEKNLRTFVPEKNEYTPVAYFEFSRYTKGQFAGLFLVHQLVTEDAHGKPLKKPVKKLVAEGVDMVIALSSMETALRKKVFR